MTCAITARCAELRPGGNSELSDRIEKSFYPGGALLLVREKGQPARDGDRLRDLRGRNIRSINEILDHGDLKASENELKVTRVSGATFTISDVAVGYKVNV